MSVQDGDSRRDSRLLVILTAVIVVLTAVGVVLSARNDSNTGVPGSSPVVIAPPASFATEPPAPTSTYPPPPTATTTPIPLPDIEVRRIGMGSPDLPLRLALDIANSAPYPVTLWGVMLDTDTHQNRMYKAGRADIDPNGGHAKIAFAAWYPGACYAPVLLMARTPKGLDDLIAWFEERFDTTRSYPGIVATGDIAIVYTDPEAVCIPENP